MTRRIHFYPLPEPPKVREVIRVAAALAGCTVEEMISPMRRRDISEWRKAAYCVARSKTRRSLPFIASQFGGRDHTTIMYGIKHANPALVETLAERVGA